MLYRFLNKFISQTPGTFAKQASRIREFLTSMEQKITEHPLWKDITDEEMEGVEEGLEKYVMTKLYDR